MKKIFVDEDVCVKIFLIGVVILDKFVEFVCEDKVVYVFYLYIIYKEYGQYMDEMDMNEMYDKFVDNFWVKKEKINLWKLFEKLVMFCFELGYLYIMF